MVSLFISSKETSKPRRPKEKAKAKGNYSSGSLLQNEHSLTVMDSVLDT
jgi:hypothetical protein